MAARGDEGADLILLDRELRLVGTVALPELPDHAQFSIRPQLGLVAATWPGALAVFDFEGRQRYRVEYDDSEPFGACAWTHDGALLWTVVPGGHDGVDVAAVDTTTGTVAATAVVRRNPNWQTAFYAVLTDSDESVVAVQGVRTNGDGTYGTLLRLEGDALVSAGDLLDDCLLLDARPGGGEMLALDLGDRDLYLCEPVSQRVTAGLSLDELAGPEPQPDEGADVSRDAGTSATCSTSTSGSCWQQPAGGQLLLLDRQPLAVAAQLRLQGVCSEPFTGWDVYPADHDHNRAHLGSLGPVDPWKPDRVVMSGRHIYDLATPSTVGSPHCQ